MVYQFVRLTLISYSQKYRLKYWNGDIEICPIFLGGISFPIPLLYLIQQYKSKSTQKCAINNRKNPPIHILRIKAAMWRWFWADDIPWIPSSGSPPPSPFPFEWPSPSSSQNGALLHPPFHRHKSPNPIHQNISPFCRHRRAILPFALLLLMLFPSRPSASPHFWLPSTQIRLLCYDGFMEANPRDVECQMARIIPLSSPSTFLLILPLPKFGVIFAIPSAFFP